MARSETIPIYTCSICQKKGNLAITLFWSRYSPYTDRLDECGDFAFCSVACLNSGLAVSLGGLKMDEDFNPSWFRLEVESSDQTGFKDMNQLLKMLHEKTTPTT